MLSLRESGVIEISSYCCYLFHCYLVSIKLQYFLLICNNKIFVLILTKMIRYSVNLINAELKLKPKYVSHYLVFKNCFDNLIRRQWLKNIKHTSIFDIGTILFEFVSVNTLTLHFAQKSKRIKRQLFWYSSIIAWWYIYQICYTIKITIVKNSFLKINGGDSYLFPWIVIWYRSNVRWFEKILRKKKEDKCFPKKRL